MTSSAHLSSRRFFELVVDDSIAPGHGADIGIMVAAVCLPQVSPGAHLPANRGWGGGAGLVFPTAPAGIRALAGGFVVGRARHCITEVLKAGEVGFLGERRGNGRGIHWTFLLVFTDISTKYTRVD